MTWVAVAIGGAIGSVARYAVAIVVARAFPHLVVPFATFAVNVVGCFIIGLLASRLAHHPHVESPELRAFVFAGFLGGFTTFSAFALDTVTLVQSGLRALAIVNALGQLITGLVAARIGWEIGTKL
jgi:CrcB protein